MRTTGSIEYTIDHGSHGAGLVATWSVPYSALIENNQVIECEPDGSPTLLRVDWYCGDERWEISTPTKPWRAAFSRATKYSEEEIAKLCAEDALAKHWARKEERVG